jgi:large repetitive protein
VGTKWIGINLVVRLLRRLSNGRLGVTAVSTVAVGCLLAFPSVGAAACPPPFYSAPTASFTASPSSPAVGDSVSFDASGSQDGTYTTYEPGGNNTCTQSTSDDPITTYHWTFGDGTTQATSGPTTSHAYGAPGNYTVKLTVSAHKTSTAVTKTVTVSKAATTASVSASPSTTTYGQNVTFSSHVTTSAASGAPGGTVTFYVDGTSIGSPGVDASGNASFSTTSIQPGSHTVTDTYNGDGNHSAGNGGPVSLTVNKLDTTTSVGSSANPSTEGGSVTFTATVAGSGAGTPTGSVQWTIDSSNVGTPVAMTAGKATYTTSGLTAGSHSVEATYLGNSYYNLSDNTPLLTQTVNKADTTTSLASSENPSNQGDSVTFTATVGSGTGTPTGSIQFTIDGSPAGSPVSLTGGKATYTTSGLASGTRSVAAVYNGDGNYNTSTSPSLTQTVNPHSSGGGGGGSGGSGTGGSGGSGGAGGSGGGGTGGSGSGGTGGSNSAAAKCLVPNTNGESLASATSALHAAHCNVGKVTTPKHAPKKGAGKNKKWALVVSSESPGAGRAVPNGTKVNLTLSYQKVQTSKKKVHK